MASEILTCGVRGNIGLIFGTHYEIIKLCLNNLPSESLHNAAAVCKSWNHVVQEIRKKRTELKCYSMMSTYPATNPLKRRRCAGNYIKETLKPVRGLSPRLCIGFSTGKLQRLYKDSTLGSTNKMHEELKSSLPPNCSSLLIVSEGIMGTLEDNTVSVTQPCMIREAFSSVILPDIPGVEFTMFRISEAKSGNFEIFQNGKFVPFPTTSEEPVKFAMILSTRHDNSAINLHKTLKKRQSEEFAIGGCVVNSCSISSTGSVRTCGLLFSGSGLHAASVVINPEDDTEEDIEQHILKLKSCDFSLLNSMAFMFSCVGRLDLNLETSLFRKHFPSTPLLGLVGNGEMGLNYIPDLKNEASKKREDVDHSYSSVLVLLSWD